MQNYIREFEKRLDKAWLTEHIISLYRIERPQTFPAYNEAAKYTYNLLKSEGFESELINIPADGKTVYQDARMPIGWNVNNMTLTLLTDVDGLKSKTLSDYSINPMSAVKHSVSTPPEGIETHLVTEEQFNSGKSVKGAFVLLGRTTRPGGKIIREILDGGAIGWVSDFCENPGEAPNHTAWINAATETGSWHVQAGERDFIAYLITPNQADCLRKACSNGDVLVHAYSDAVRYETTLPVISALLPGKSSKEVWVMAHMYEPLIDDNANGVVGSIAILKALRDMAAEGKINLKYSVRVVFAGEIYGFASAAEYYGGDLSQKTIGAINMDGLPASVEKGKYRNWRIFEAPDVSENACNIFLHLVENEALKLHPEYSFITYPSSYGDDQALSDSTVGLPTAWFLRGDYKCFHHNSILNEEVLDVDVFTDTLTLSGSWICAMAAFGEKDVLSSLPQITKRAQEVLNKSSKDEVRRNTDTTERLKFLYKRESGRIRSLKLWADIPDVDEAVNSLVIPPCRNTFITCDDRWFNRGEDYVFKRKTRGLPMDMTLINNPEEQKLRGFFVYYPVADFLSRMDGVKSFKTIVAEYEWDKNTIMSEENIEKYLKICITLSENGYLERII